MISTRVFFSHMHTFFYIPWSLTYTIFNSISSICIKLASCSVLDSPLVEKVASARMPTVISTGGASVQEIDWVVRLLENNADPLAIHHCVSIYPTPSHQMQLNQAGNPLIVLSDFLGPSLSAYSPPANHVRYRCLPTGCLAYDKREILIHRYVGTLKMMKIWRHKPLHCG
mgnify:CR=1 FL=1